MKKNYFIAAALLLSSITFAQKTPKPDKSKTNMINHLDGQYAHYKDIAHQIWEWSEVGYKEVKSSALLQKTLTEAGFKVEAGIAGMPTAFVATWGTDGPVIGILAEFDALPGLSQTASASKEVDPNRDAGHACGHHLFGTASVAAAIELKNELETTGKKAILKVYGTPAEEGGSGKVYLTRDGFFKDVDVVLNWHPGDGNNSNLNTSLANITAKFRFKGISAHAAVAPEQGRSALDGVEAMNYMVNMMREHVPSDARIHYVITQGGKAPNVVPDFAEVYYYARHVDPEIVKDIFARMVNASKGAALGTGTEVSHEIIGGVYNLLPVESLARMMQRNLALVGGVTYTAEDLAFGKAIQSTLMGTNLPSLSSAAEVEPFSVDSRKGGSTDVGDVSWAVPTVGARIATWVPGVPAHSWQAVSCGDNEVGYKGMMVAAKTMATTGWELINNPVAIVEARKEWLDLRGPNYVYTPLIGDRKPALNYRDNN
uniref:amidohydrolase n=2 Tax=Roseivirga sp. TaxID=1964215 RepID=UPI00404860D3